MNRLYLIAGLAAALCISLGINFMQYRSDLIEDTKAPLQAQIDAAAHRQEVTDAVAAARAEDDAELVRLRQAVADATGREVVVYRDRVKRVPAPTCAPGHERVVAWNAAGQVEEPR